MYELMYKKQAKRALEKMPRNTERLIREKMGLLAQNPNAYNPNVTKLRDREGYRLRVGDWRVIYHKFDDKLIILAVKIAPRGEVYR